MNKVIYSNMQVITIVGTFFEKTLETDIKREKVDQKLHARQRRRLSTAIQTTHFNDSFHNSE